MQRARLRHLGSALLVLMGFDAAPLGAQVAPTPSEQVGWKAALLSMLADKLLVGRHNRSCHLSHSSRSTALLAPWFVSYRKIFELRHLSMCKRAHVSGDDFNKICLTLGARLYEDVL
jgi:hypothetical protein